VDVAARSLRRVQEPARPITVGGAALGGRIYFGCGHELRCCG